MLNIKHHLDTNNYLFSNKSQINDPGLLKKCMQDTNTFITDLLKQLNNLLNEVQKNSYYLSLIFLKTDKLKETINQIFPFLDNIVNHIQKVNQQKEEIFFNEFQYTLRDSKNINELLRLCKFELSEIYKVKNYAQKNTMSEDVLKIFTVFLNLGKNPNFINSLLMLFKNIKEASQNQCDKGKNNSGFQRSQENNNGNYNNYFNESVDENNNNNCGKNNETETNNFDLPKEKSRNDNIHITDKIKSFDIFSSLNFPNYFDKNFNISENIDFCNKFNQNIKEIELSNVINNNLYLNEEKIENFQHNKDISKNSMNDYSNFMETKKKFNTENIFSNINQKLNSDNENKNLIEIKLGSSLIGNIDKIAKNDAVSKVFQEKERENFKNEGNEKEKANKIEIEKEKEEKNITEIKTQKEVKIEKEDILSLKEAENKDEEKIDLEINLLNESYYQKQIPEKNSDISENPLIKNPNLLKYVDHGKNVSFCNENSFGLKNENINMPKELENYSVNKIYNNNNELNLQDIVMLGVENKLDYENIEKNEILQIDKLELEKDKQKFNFFSDNVFPRKILSISIPNDPTKNEKNFNYRNFQLENLKQDENLHYQRKNDSQEKEFQNNEDPKEIYCNNTRDNIKNSMDNEKNDCQMETIFLKEKQSNLKLGIEQTINKGNSPHPLEHKKKCIEEFFDENMFIDNIKTNNISSLVKKKKEDIFTITQTESNININMHNKNFSPKNNNLNANNIGNSSVIFRSKKSENNYFINSNIFDDKYNGNNRLINNIIDCNNNIFNNINYLNKIPSLDSKYPTSRINQHTNDLYFKNGNFSDNNLKISPSKQLLNEFRNNINPVKIEEKKNYLYNNNDADDSINIQEHFNVNFQHDNIINDEPIKNTILELAYQQTNETSSPKGFGLAKKMNEKF